MMMSIEHCVVSSWQTHIGSRARQPAAHPSQQIFNGIQLNVLQCDGRLPGPIKTPTEGPGHYSTSGEQVFSPQRLLPDGSGVYGGGYQTRHHMYVGTSVFGLEQTNRPVGNGSLVGSVQLDSWVR